MCGKMWLVSVWVLVSPSHLSDTMAVLFAAVAASSLCVYITRQCWRRWCKSTDDQGYDADTDEDEDAITPVPKATSAAGLDACCATASRRNRQSVLQRKAVTRFHFAPKGFQDVHLTAVQRRALRAIGGHAQTLSMEAMAALAKRVQKLGFSGQQLARSLAFVRDEASLIIHVDLAACLSELAADTHYRSCYETRRGGDTHVIAYRSRWESRVFLRLYDEAQAAERMKYGTINTFNDVGGNRACFGYGRSYFVLRDRTVRWRTTLTAYDSSACLPHHLGTLQHCAHVFKERSDDELVAWLRVGGELVPSVSSAPFSDYLEIQIHGDLVFSRDVLCLAVAKQDATNALVRPLVKPFANKNGIQVKWL